MHILISFKYRASVDVDGNLKVKIYKDE